MILESPFIFNYSILFCSVLSCPVPQKDKLFHPTLCGSSGVMLVQAREKLATKHSYSSTPALLLSLGFVTAFPPDLGTLQTGIQSMVAHK